MRAWTRGPGAGPSSSELALLLVFIFGAVAETWGGSQLVAGFVAGLVLGRLREPTRLATQLSGLADGFLVPAFFVLLGARLDLRALAGDPGALAFMVLDALLVVVRPPGRRAWPCRAAAADRPGGLGPAGPALGGRDARLQAGVLSPALAAALVGAALLTLIPATIGSFRLAERSRRRAAPAASRHDRSADMKQPARIPATFRTSATRRDPGAGRRRCRASPQSTSARTPSTSSSPTLGRPTRERDRSSGRHSESALVELGRVVDRRGRITAAPSAMSPGPAGPDGPPGGASPGASILIAATEACRRAANGPPSWTGSASVSPAIRSCSRPQPAKPRSALPGCGPSCRPRAISSVVDSGGASTEVTLTRGRRDRRRDVPACRGGAARRQPGR